MMVFKSCAIILLLGVASTSAGYCGRNRPNCCLETSIDKRSCNGSGTSDVTDLFSYIYKGKPTYCVAGKPGEVYRVWGFDTEFKRGIQTLGHFNGIFAYMFQIPRSANDPSQSDYYILNTGTCPKLIPVCSTTKGTIAGTDVPYKEVVRVAEFNNRKYFPAPCQVLQGTYDSYDSNEDVALNTKTLSSFSGLTCIRYLSRNATYDSYPDAVIAEYGLYVKPGVNGNDGMYCQDGYPNGQQYTCRDPSPNTATGYCLRRSGFNWNNKNGPGQVCLLSQYVARCFAPQPVPHASFVILTFITPPYQYETIIYMFEQGDIYFPTYRGLYSLAC